MAYPRTDKIYDLIINASRRTDSVEVGIEAIDKQIDEKQQVSCN
jgi:hypothetical protein